MPDKTKDTLRLILMVLGCISVFASPIIAVTAATFSAKEARADAEEAKETAEDAHQLAEQNARDFQFFKGEVNAKLDNITKGQDRLLVFMGNLERAN